MRHKISELSATICSIALHKKGRNVAHSQTRKLAHRKKIRNASDRLTSVFFWRFQDKGDHQKDYSKIDTGVCLRRRTECRTIIVHKLFESISVFDCAVGQKLSTNHRTPKPAHVLGVSGPTSCAASARASTSITRRSATNGPNKQLLLCCFLFGARLRVSFPNSRSRIFFDTCFPASVSAFSATILVNHGGWFVHARRNARLLECCSLFRLRVGPLRLSWTRAQSVCVSVRSFKRKFGSQERDVPRSLSQMSSGQLQGLTYAKSCGSLMPLQLPWLRWWNEKRKKKTIGKQKYLKCLISTLRVIDFATLLHCILSWLKKENRFYWIQVLNVSWFMSSSVAVLTNVSVVDTGNGRHLWATGVWDKATQDSSDHSSMIRNEKKWGSITDPDYRW